MTDGTGYVATILVVDDEKNYRIILASLFSRAGYRVLTAADEAVCLAILGRQHVDLILTDLDLCGGDGLALCRSIQSVRGGTPCIVFSACLPARRGEHEKRETGIIDYVAKPFDNRILLGKVASALQTGVAHQLTPLGNRGENGVFS